MRNRIFGAIGALWGGSIVLNWLFSSPVGSGAYRSGQSGAAVFGLVMAAAGIYYFFKKPSDG